MQGLRQLQVSVCRRQRLLSRLPWPGQLQVACGLGPTWQTCSWLTWPVPCASVSTALPSVLSSPGTERTRRVGPTCARACRHAASGAWAQRTSRTRAADLGDRPAAPQHLQFLDGPHEVVLAHRLCPGAPALLRCRGGRQAAGKAPAERSSGAAQLACTILHRAARSTRPPFMGRVDRQPSTTWTPSS